MGLSAIPVLLIFRSIEHDLSEVDLGERDVKVVAEYVYKSFNIDTIDNDLALLQLQHDVTGDHVAYACLPGRDWSLPAGKLCHILGWGRRSNRHFLGSNVLREAEVPIATTRACRAAFSFDVSNDSQVCAGYKRGGSDTCLGDSGGPLLCSLNYSGTSRWFLYGVTSFGEGCGQQGKFGIYTKVSNFIDWIKTITNIT